MSDSSKNATIQFQFKTLQEVHAHITEVLGKKVSISKLRKDSAAKAIAKQPDGTWSMSAVMAYASMLPDSPTAAKRDPSAFGEYEDLGRIKMEREIEKMEAQTRSIKFKHEVERGQYFSKNEVWLELASRAAVLYQGLRQSLLASVPKIVQSYKDWPERPESALEQAIELALNEAINQFSRPMTLDVETWDGTVNEEVEDATNTKGDGDDD